MLTERLTTAFQAPMRSLAQVVDDVLARDVDLPAALDAPRHEIATADAGIITYYADTSVRGRPLVLLHGVHAAASSYEMKPLFEYFRQERPVYALDLPGFGFSERVQRAYTPATYVHAIEHLLRNVSTREPVDVIALSLTSEYVAKVALEMPELVRSLVLISPTGFSDERERSLLETLSRQRARMLPTGLSETLTGRLLYELIVCKPSIRYFLRKSFEHRVDEHMAEYAWATSHQPGAFHAPMAFLGGGLFPRGQATNIYGHVHAPALVLYDRDPHTGFAALSEFAERHHNFRTERVTPSRGLPHFDLPEHSIEAIRSFLEEQDQRRAPRPYGMRAVGSA
ncbi:MAG TPA: alpha/beta hydrolase [Polyangiales bacterium]|nr:alpha/beta hydrolase [Polyangiales bacterium]